MFPRYNYKSNGDYGGFMDSKQEFLLLWEAVEEVFGSGGVMRVEDYIMEKKKEVITMVKRYIIKDTFASEAWEESAYYQYWEKGVEVGNYEGMGLTTHKEDAHKFLCKCDAQKFIDRNGIGGHCEILEVVCG